MRLPSRIYASVNLDAVEHNFEMMRRQTGDVPICAVIKTDGYGHGALQIAGRMESRPYIWGFAVATAAEAVQLREGGVKKPILVLGYVFPDEYEDLIRYEIRSAVFTTEMAQALSDTAARMGRERPHPIHLAVDTGMTRIGLPDDEEGIRTAKRIAAMPGLEVEGMFTHFARADEVDKTAARQALERYLAFLKQLEKAGIHIPIRHTANSAAILEMKEAHLDMVRAGITIYGIYPSEEMVRDKDLQPVMELKSHVAYVKTVKAGVPVSYGGTFVTEKETRIATVPAGYGDGYPRSLSNKGWVLIGGRKAYILGRVCMDQFMVDVTGMNVRVGDEVTLMGRDGSLFLGAEELGDLSGRFSYELVCDIGKRVPRVYLPEQD